jgi:signal transduction histidine kinase
MKKAKQKTDWFIVGAYSLVFAIVLGLGINVAFVAHSLFSPVFVGYDWALEVFAWSTGLLVALGDFGLFLKTERAWRAITVYSEHTGESPHFRQAALVFLNLIFIGVEIAGLVYRADFLASKGVGWLVAIGILLSLAPPVIGLVLHPLVEPPVELLEDLRVEDFERAHIQELYDDLKALPLPERHKAYMADRDGYQEAFQDAIEEAEEKERERAARKRLKANRRVLTNRNKNSVTEENFQ